MHSFEVHSNKSVCRKSGSLGLEQIQRKMSRRYGNRIGDHGGFGRVIWTSNPKIIHTKNTVEDYLFYVGSSNQASDYEITAELGVNHIKRHSIAATMSQRHCEFWSKHTQMSGS